MRYEIRLKSKIRVQDITLTEEQQDEINQIEANSHFGPKGKRERVKRISGACRVCGAVCSKKVITEDKDGAQVIERYCLSHFKALMET